MRYAALNLITSPRFFIPTFFWGLMCWIGHILCKGPDYEKLANERADFAYYHSSDAVENVSYKIKRVGDTIFVPGEMWIVVKDSIEFSVKKPNHE